MLLWHRRYPSLSTVRQLIYKRGYAKVKGQRIAITDNALIEKKLGTSSCVHFLFSVFPLYGCILYCFTNQRKPQKSELGIALDCFRSP